MQLFAIEYAGEALNIEVPEGTDLDDDFQAHDAETGEPLMIHGWMIETFERVLSL